MQEFLTNSIKNTINNPFLLTNVRNRQVNHYRNAHLLSVAEIFRLAVLNSWAYLYVNVFVDCKHMMFKCD